MKNKSQEAFSHLAATRNPTAQQVDSALVESGIDPKSAVSVSAWSRTQVQNAAIIAMQGRRIARLEQALKAILKDHADIKRTDKSNRSLPRKNTY